MADQQETFDQIDSTELFDSAVSDDPAPIQDASPEPVAAAEQPRGPDGKFAAKVAEPEAKEEPPQAAQAEPAKDEANVPSWRLREISEERRAAVARAEQAERQAQEFQRQMAELQKKLEPKPDPVDVFADPDKWAKEQFKPLEQRMAEMTTNLTLRASRAENVAIHGRETVDAAEKAIGKAMNSRHPDLPALRAKMAASDDPVGVAIEWHKSQSLLKETGGDLNAYKARALDEALKDPAFLAKALEAARTQANGGQARPSTTVQLPPSLNRIAAAGPATDDPGDSSDESLFKFATG